jgi:RNA polymerase sigma-70 factor (ECF subfamily)
VGAEGKATKEDPLASTASLLDRACSGDRRALDQLLVACRPRALALALKVLRNADDAEDAVQEAFVKVWRYIGRFERRSSFTTWLHRIVMNACLDLLRRQASRPVGVDEPADDAATDPREGVVELTPEAMALSAETTALVHRALDQLSPVHKSALALRELQEHTYDEIARACRCPVGTVMSRLHHARRRFVDEWKRVVVAAQLMPCAA